MDSCVPWVISSVNWDTYVLNFDSTHLFTEQAEKEKVTSWSSASHASLSVFTFVLFIHRLSEEKKAQQVGFSYFENNFKSWRFCCFLLIGEYRWPGQVKKSKFTQNQPQNFCWRARKSVLSPICSLVFFFTIKMPVVRLFCEHQFNESFQAKLKRKPQKFQKCLNLTLTQKSV